MASSLSEEPIKADDGATKIYDIIGEMLLGYEAADSEESAKLLCKKVLERLIEAGAVEAKCALLPGCIGCPCPCLCFTADRVNRGSAAGVEPQGTRLLAAPVLLANTATVLVDPMQKQITFVITEEQLHSCESKPNSRSKTPYARSLRRQHASVLDYEFEFGSHEWRCSFPAILTFFH